MEKIHQSWIPVFEDYEFDLDLLDKPKPTKKDKKKNNDKNNDNDTDIIADEDPILDIVYPSKDLIFKVFEMDVKDIKVVLLGQDPYHNPKQANGLSFSVADGVPVPPSLKNIYKELVIEFPSRNYVFNTGNLERWFNEEKIFLLNASLSVIQNKPGSHMGLWEQFTDDVIRFISENNSECVFLLLGNFAKSKSKFIVNKDKIVSGIHPSPLSAHNGFFNSGIFKEVEKKIGNEINWNN